MEPLYIYACWGKPEKNTFPTYNSEIFKVITSRTDDWFVGLQLIDTSLATFKYSCGGEWCAWHKDISNFSKIELFSITKDFMYYECKRVFGNNPDYDITKEDFKKRILDSFGEIEFLETQIYPAIDASEHIDKTTFIEGIKREAKKLDLKINIYCKKYEDILDTSEVMDIQSLFYCPRQFSC